MAPENLQATWMTEALLFSADIAVICTYPNGTIRAFNRCAESMFGLAADTVVNHRQVGDLFSLDELLAADHEDAAFDKSSATAAPYFSASAYPLSRNMLCQNHSGSLFKVRVTVFPYRCSEADASGHIFVAQGLPDSPSDSEHLEALCEEYVRQISRLSEALADTSEALRKERRAREPDLSPNLNLQDVDCLTGLATRHHLIERLTQMIALADRDLTGLGIFSVDLDNYKAANVAFGHGIGDMILVEATKKLVGMINENDVLARVSGDEFVLVLAGVSSLRRATVVAEMIQKTLADICIDVGGHDLLITASIGISLFPESGKTPEALLRTADAAMERARSDGGSCARFFSSEMTAEAQDNLRMSSHLRNALDRSEFVLHYQPLLDIDTGNPCCAEALIRWNHPVLGQVPPAKFIGLAERSGLIVDIGNWVLQEACQAAARWHATHQYRIPVAVNLSPCQFHQRNLVDDVREALAAANLPAECLVLELTESSLMTNLDESEKTLRQLDNMGVCIAIDDFGTGYSSLAYLKRLPVRRLKIDKSFVRDITTNNVDRGIISAILGLAAHLEMSVVAEGVETAEQAEQLSLLGCRVFQGYHFSRPVADNDVKNVFSRMCAPSATPVHALHALESQLCCGHSEGLH